MKGSSLSTRCLLNGYSELLNVTNVTICFVDLFCFIFFRASNVFKSLRFLPIPFPPFPGYAMGQRAKGRPARSTRGGKREDFGAKCCGALRVDADL